jgi:hypothetical protein
LHVLGTPPAFVLSQDQTLHHIPERINLKFSLLNSLESLSSAVKVLVFPEDKKTGTSPRRLPYQLTNLPTHGTIPKAAREKRMTEKSSGNQLILTFILLFVLLLAVIFLANLIGALHVFG